MSSILEALKKSEQQRDLGRDLVFLNTLPNAGSRVTRPARAMIAMLLFLTVAIATLLFGLREETPNALSGHSVHQTTVSIGDGSGLAARMSAGQATQGNRPAMQHRATPLTEMQVNSGPASAEQASPTRAAFRPPTEAAAGPVPWLSRLPMDFRNSLPPLAVNIHVFSPDAAQRILYINNRQALQGERIEGGVQVEEIVRDGVVLRFRGQLFKLPRPS